MHIFKNDIVATFAYRKLDSNPLKHCQQEIPWWPKNIVWQLFIKINIQLPYETTFAFMGVEINENICNSVYMFVLIWCFHTIKKESKPKYLLKDEWLKELRQPCCACYLLMTSSELLTCPTTLRNSENVFTLSKKKVFYMCQGSFANGIMLP